MNVSRWISSQPFDLDIRVVALIAHLPYWSTAGLREVYILINFDVLNALEKFVLQSEAISISFGDGRGILILICAILCPLSIKFAVLA